VRKLKERVTIIALCQYFLDQKLCQLPLGVRVCVLSSSYAVYIKCFTVKKLRILPHNILVNFEYKKSSPYRIFIWQGGNGKGFSYNTSVFPCQYNFINAPYSYSIHLKWRCIICFKQHYVVDICMNDSVFCEFGREMTQLNSPSPLLLCWNFAFDKPEASEVIFLFVYRW